MLTFEQLPNLVAQLISEVGELKSLVLTRENLKIGLQHDDEVLNVRQAAELLDLTPETIYSLKCRGEIPACKRGKRLYFLRSNLIDWIKDSKQKTFKDAEFQAAAYINSKTRKS